MFRVPPVVFRGGAADSGFGLRDFCLGHINCCFRRFDCRVGLTDFGIRLSKQGLRLLDVVQHFGELRA